MSSRGCNLTAEELNNQFIMGNKLPPQTRSGIVNDPPSVASDNMNDSMPHITTEPTVGMETDFEHMENKVNCEEPKLSKEDPQETRHLKELLLLHLDWIHQQQESLLTKDRQILRLKQEKEALKCRLERMDRRMSLLRQKADPCPLSPGDSPRKDGSSGPGTELGTPPSGRTDSRGFKRKHSLEPTSLGKRFNAVANADSTEDATTPPQQQHTQSAPPAAHVRRRIIRMPRAHRHHHKHQYLFSQQPPRKCRANQPVKTEESSDAQDMGGEEDDDEVQFMDHRRLPQSPRVVSMETTKDRPILRTDTMYYLPVQVDLPSWEISPKKEATDENVVVPTWRIRQVPTGYQLEGTENLTDEIYNKRHMKPETDEKRRKRWDAQMMREQKMLERLQQRSGGTPLKGSTPSISNTPKQKKQIEEEPLYSFLPSPDNVKYVEICDKVPVAAFGYSIPDLAPSEFSLPWFDADQHSKSDSSRGHKGRRKHML